jgi:hypothetical protein
MPHTTPFHTGKNQSGIAMLGIVLVIVIILIALVSAVSLGPKLQNIANERKTSKGANVIVDAMRQYYLARGELPGSSPVPVGDLSLEQKYRYDAWGKEWEYYKAPTITGMTVDGQQVAGVLISGGPDQVRGTNVDDTVTPWVLTTSGLAADDDIVIPINVQAEAIQIARDEMEVLRHKVWINACTAPGTPMPAINHFGLGSTYQNDPWSNPYILISSTGVRSTGPDGIQDTSDDIFLPHLTNDCPDGLSPLSTPVAKASFESLAGNTISFGPDDGTLHGPDATSNSDTPNGSTNSLKLEGNEHITINGSSTYGSRYDFSLKQPFTLSIWVKFLDNGNSWTNLFSKYEDTTKQSGYQLIRHNRTFDNRIYFFLTSDNSTNKQIRVRGQTNIMDVDNIDHWHFITVTYDAQCNEDRKVNSNNIKIYIDGIEDGTISEAPGTQELNCDEDSINNLVPLRISGRNDGLGNLHGLIDDVAVYDKDLDAEEVKQLYYLSSIIRYEFKGGLRDFSRRNRGGIFMYDGSPASSSLPSYVNDRFGNNESALQFGSGVYVQNEGYSGFLNGLSKFTLLCWIKSNTTNTDNGFIFGRFPPNDQDRWFGLRYDANGVLSSSTNIIKGGINTNASSGPDFQAIESSAKQSTSWQQVAMTWSSGNNINLYINGALDASSSFSTNSTGQIENINNFLIGKGAKDTSPSDGWSGLIDDVTIFPRLLSPAEIQKNWDEYLNQ